VIRELAQAAQSSSQGWTPEAYAASARAFALAVVLPGVIFVALSILVERRAGARWLAPLWAIAMAFLLAYGSIGFHHISGRRAEMLRSMGGIRSLYIVAALIYGVPFALSALTTWWLGAHTTRRTWLQITGTLLAWVIAVPLAILVSGATESFWAK
jgi:hypothetical protein